MVLLNVNPYTVEERESMETVVPRSSRALLASLINAERRDDFELCSRTTMTVHETFE